MSEEKNPKIETELREMVAKMLKRDDEVKYWGQKILNILDNKPKPIRNPRAGEGLKFITSSTAGMITTTVSFNTIGICDKCKQEKRVAHIIGSGNVGLNLAIFKYNPSQICEECYNGVETVSTNVSFDKVGVCDICKKEKQVAYILSSGSNDGSFALLDPICKECYNKTA